MAQSPKKTTTLLRIAAPRTQARIKLISTDFDGTLIGDNVPSEAMHAFFEMLKEQRRVSKVKWVINTGRNWESLVAEMQARGFAILPDYVILAEREVHRIHRDHPVGDYEWNQMCDEQHARLFEQTRDLWERLRDFVASQTGAELGRDRHSPVTIRACSDHEADRIQQFIQRELEQHPEVAVVRNFVYFRFSHRAYDKGTALHRVQLHTGATARETYAVGDHYNDLPMLRREIAHYLACPVNAIEPVKQQVRGANGYVASGEATWGVLEGWKHFQA